MVATPAAVETESSRTPRGRHFLSAIESLLPVQSNSGSVPGMFKITVLGLGSRCWERAKPENHEEPLLVRVGLTNRDGPMMQFNIRQLPGVLFSSFLVMIQKYYSKDIFSISNTYRTQNRKVRDKISEIK